MSGRCFVAFSLFLMEILLANNVDPDQFTFQSVLLCIHSNTFSNIFRKRIIVRKIVILGKEIVGFMVECNDSGQTLEIYSNCMWPIYRYFFNV